MIDVFLLEIERKDEFDSTFFDLVNKCDQIDLIFRKNNPYANHKELP